MHPKNLRAHLDSAAGIAGLLPQAERLIKLRQIYEKLVPQQLLQSSSIVNYRQRRIVIFAANNAVAAKLKLLTPRLIDDFSRFGAEVTGIRLEVQPSQTPAAECTRKGARLSQAGSESLRALARRLPESRLRQAVAALAEKSTPEEESQTAADEGHRRRPAATK